MLYLTVGHWQHCLSVCTDRQKKMAAKMTAVYRHNFPVFVINIILFLGLCNGNDILGCGGFVKSHANLDFSKIEIGLYTREGSLKEKTECAPNNGYYFLPLYEKGDYILKIHPPAGWSFEPSQVDLSINGVDDQCSMGQDINFSFNGFGITGRVITAGEKQGPSGITVQLIDENGNKKDTLTAAEGDFHFTPVIPGKYTVKASHPRWKLEPSQSTVQVKEGNTVLPIGSLAVRGYEVKGSVHTEGNPISGLHVLLYSKQENPKFRVEGCTTALLQGVPDSPICYSVTDSSGEFNFGLVPAGEYKLLALAKPPGQAVVSYNVRPDLVKFTVKHENLFIKNAFEVSGFTVTGSVLASGSGAGLRGVRVALDGQPAAASDDKGKYTLPALRAGVYTVTFEHELAQFDPVKLTIAPSGAVRLGAAAAARWRVCGAVGGGAGRGLTLQGALGAVAATADHSENWCTFLAPGVYTAKVEVSEQEQRDGLQFYPLSQKVTVGSSAVNDVMFSQLKATLTGSIKCLDDDESCRRVTVTCRPLSPDGSYIGKPVTTQAQDGEYTLSDVLPGSVEVSVPTARHCWAAAAHNVPVAAARHTLPHFVHTGHALPVHSTHDILVDYSSGTDNGTLRVPAGHSVQCVSARAQYKLQGRSCHRLQPPELQVDTRQPLDKTIYFVAVAHEVGVTVTSTEKVSDLTLKVNSDRGVTSVGPIVPELVDGEYVYKHSLHMTEGEVAVFTPSSATLLFQPASVQVVGTAECRPAAAQLRARRGLVLGGRLEPAVEGATVTLTADDMVQSQVTGPDGTYRFGPLEANRQYKVTAHKESYDMGDPDAEGVIAARRLAEILVLLQDEADGSPLEGALVSVSGGSYRRNLVSDSSGSLRFPSLPPGEYYVKPHMKEYKLAPPHATLRVREGAQHTHTLRGTRVACRAYGRVVSVSGAGLPAALLAAPAQAASTCAALETRADAEGNFRLRGLLPGCDYRLSLKPAPEPELAPLTLAHAPLHIQVKEKKDIEGLRLIAIQPNHLTDTSVVVHTPLLDHYRTLRLTLALEDSPTSPIYVTKLDAAGFSAALNPGVLLALPRLPADRNSYVIRLESSLSRSSHSFEEQTFYFTSDGRFKHFDVQFLPKVRTVEQERGGGLAALPLLAAVAAAFLYREPLLARLAAAAARPAAKQQAKPARAPRPELLDKASIDQIVSSVNAAPRRQVKKKTQLAG